MHKASEMRVLVARGRRISLLLVRERSRRLLFHEDFRDRAAAIKAKSKSRFPISQDIDVLFLPSAWTYEKGLPSKARIPGFWDNAVLIISGIGGDIVCSFSPQCGSKEPASISGVAQAPFTTQTGQRGQGMGRGREQGSQAETSGTQGLVYTIVPPTEPADQSVIHAMFLLSHLWARILFDSGVLHSFIGASYVR